MQGQSANPVPDRQPAPEAAGEQPAPGQSHHGRSRPGGGRRVILLGLLALAAAVGLGVVIQSRLDAARQRSRAASAVTLARQALASGNLPQAQDYIAQAFGVDPEDKDAAGLAVAMTYAGSRLDVATNLFNQLDPVRLMQWLDAADREEARNALTQLKVPAEDQDRLAMTEADTAYLNECSVLWWIATDASRAASDERGKALALCRWLALHTLPEAAAPPATPLRVLWRGRGSSEQLAWTYAELGRQAGLRCGILPPEAGRTPYLVAVFPAQGEPILIDAAAGAPAEGVRAAGGTDAEAGRAMAAFHPDAFLTRFAAFERLLNDLPSHPRIAFSLAQLPPGRPVRYWPVPAESVAERTDPARVAAIQATDRPMQLLGAARNLQLQSFYPQADAAFRQIADYLRDRLAEAEVQEAADVIRQAQEHLAFFRGLNYYDGGRLDDADATLSAYLDSYPEGRWRPLAQAVRAEIQAEKGDTAAAEALWKALPAVRSQYAEARIQGLLSARAPMVAGPAPAPPGPAAAP